MFTRLVEMKSTPGKSQELADLIDAKAVVVHQNLSLHKKVLWCSALISHFRKGSFGTAGELNEIGDQIVTHRGPLDQ